MKKSWREKRRVIPEFEVPPVAVNGNNKGTAYVFCWTGWTHRPDLKPGEGKIELSAFDVMGSIYYVPEHDAWVSIFRRRLHDDRLIGAKSIDKKLWYVGRFESEGAAIRSVRNMFADDDCHVVKHIVIEHGEPGMWGDDMGKLHVKDVRSDPEWAETFSDWLGEHGFSWQYDVSKEGNAPGGDA